jgi:2-C-methyl-D-erythritol 4-phosphate cytidylyltransferase
MGFLNMTITAIIVAAGSGSRLGGPTPKGFIRLGRKALFLYSLEMLLSHKAVADAVLVVPKGFEPRARKIVTGSGIKKNVAIVAGGRERWQSVENGVRAARAEWVLVHDAARPFVTRAVIDAMLEKKNKFDCVITATPEVDTVRVVKGELAGEIVDRSKLVRVGTPQLFRRSLLLEAFATARDLPSPPPTDEAALMQRIRVPVALAAGDPANFKITTPADLSIAEALIAYRQ